MPVRPGVIAPAQRRFGRISGDHLVLDRARIAQHGIPCAAVLLDSFYHASHWLLSSRAKTAGAPSAGVRVLLSLDRARKRRRRRPRLEPSRTKCPGDLVTLGEVDTATRGHEG